MQGITLIIPGLLPPPAAITEAELPDCKTLTRLLSRAAQGDCSRDYYRLLFELFSMTLDAEADYPVAPLGYLAETGNRPQYCLRADPVHLSASREGMALMDNSMIGLQAEESGALALELQPLLAAFNATLSTPHPAHWYINCPEKPAIRTTPLPKIVGRDVSTALPVGTDQTRWRQLFNELQMVLHTCEINQTRSRQGRLSVNSLWFWGLGSLPDRGHGEFDCCFSDDPFVRGLGMLHEVPAMPLPDSATTVLEQAGQARHILVTDDSARQVTSYGDVPGWLDVLDQLEQRWMVPLDNALRHGEIRQLRIMMPGVQFICRRHQQWCFWRRPLSLMNRRLQPVLTEYD